MYHVMARGVGSQIIFEDSPDRTMFIGLMERELANEGDLLAWCLMDNHFHILVELDMTSLSAAMRRMLSAYATYFNMRYGRTGHLFQDRFASEPIDSDEYLLAVVRYIHRNPVKAGISKTCNYRWSSYGAYVSGNGTCSTKRVLEMLGSADEFVRFHSSEGQEKCLDILPTRSRVDENTALEIAQKVLGQNPAACAAALDRAERDRAIRELRDSGLTIKQIQRFTGFGRGVIQRA